MDEALFWRLIDEARQASGGEPSRQAELLTQALIVLSEEDIVEFDALFYYFHANAYDGDLWNAAAIISCGCSDSGFLDFRSWLIAQGEAVYENALSDPESLVDVVTNPEATLDGSAYFSAWYAYETKTGKKLERHLVLPLKRNILEEQEKLLEETEANEKFPKLAAKFEDCSWLL